MSFGKGNNTTTQTTGPSPQAYSAYQNLLNRAQDVSNTPYAAYTGEMVAPVNAQQNLGIGNINQNAGYAMPFIGQAANYANQAAAPITGNDIAQYQSPYTSAVINATQAQFANQNAQQQSALTGNAAAQGALGGDRVGVAQAILAGQQQLAQAPVIANLQNQGFQNAQQMALNQRQNLGNAAYSLGNLGVSGQNAALQGAGAQVGAGSLQQQTQQALDAARMQEFFRQQAYPFQTTQWLAGIDTGVGSQMGGTSTTTPPPPNPFNTALGLGLSALSFFAKDGGRIRRDTGGGLGGTPWAGAQGWVPGINITGGSGPPKPPSTGGQQQSPFDMKAGLGAAKGAKSLWDKYGPATGGPLDIGGASIDPTGIGGLAPIGSAPELGFGFGPIYRDGGAVRHFEDGGLALAGYGTGSVLPFEDRWSPVPEAVRGGMFDPQGANATGFGDVAQAEGAVPPGPKAVATIPVRKPTSIGDAELPPEITTGSSRPSETPPADSGVLAYGPGAQGLGAAPPAAAGDQAAPDKPSGGLLSRFGVNLDPDLRRSLLAAGFGLMASKSPFLGQAIGEAGLAGMGTYSGIQEEKRKAKSTEATIQHGKDQLAQAAKLAQDKLAAEQKRWTDTLDEQKAVHAQTAQHQADVLAETKRQHQMALKAPVTIDYDPKTGNPILAFPRINANGDIEYRLRDGTIVNPTGEQAPPSPTLSPGQPPGPTSALPSSPANAGTKTAALTTGTATDAPRPGEGIIQANTRVAQAAQTGGGYDYGSDAPYVEKGMEVPEPAALAGRSVQSLKTDAESFLLTGKLPTVARGNSPVARVQQSYQNAVKNYGNALAQSRGMTPEQVADAWRTAPGMLRFILGADGRATVSLGTAVRHLDTMQQLADAWAAKDTQAINRIRAVLSREFGSDAATNLQAASRIVGPEIIKAIGVAGAGTADEREHAAAALSAAASPEQMRGAIQTTQRLLAGQLEGRKRQAANAGVSEQRFKSLIGDRPYELLSGLEKGAHGAAPAAIPADQREKALDWANKNPNDPRAKDIKRMLGVP